jgi:hypothetical protein
VTCTLDFSDGEATVDSQTVSNRVTILEAASTTRVVRPASHPLEPRVKPPLEAVDLDVSTDIQTSQDTCESESLFVFSNLEGNALILDLTDPESANSNALYFAWGRRPSPTDFDRAADTRFRSDQRLVIPLGRSQDEFVIVRSTILPDGTAMPTLHAELDDLALERMSVTSMGRGDTEETALHAVIRGAGFDDETTSALKGSGDDDSRVAEPTLIVSGDHAEVQFDIAGLSPTEYTLLATKPGGISATLPEALEISPKSTGSILRVEIIAPEIARKDTVQRITIEYENIGKSEMIAPLFRLGIDNAEIRLERDSGFQGNEILILGTHPGGVPGFLPPGGKGSAAIVFRGTC